MERAIVSQNRRRRQAVTKEQYRDGHPERIPAGALRQDAEDGEGDGLSNRDRSELEVRYKVA